MVMRRRIRVSGSSEHSASSSTFISPRPLKRFQTMFSALRPPLISSLVTASRSSSVNARWMVSPIRQEKSGGWAAKTRPSSSIGRMYSWMRVRSRQRMWLPSTSASQRITIRPYRAASMLNSLPEPAPTAQNKACASALSSTCLREAFPAFTTLPRSGRMAMFSALRPALAGPAAESPSTMINSESGPWTLQSASLSGMPVEPMLAARRLVSRSCLELTRLSTALAILSLTKFT